MLTIASVWKEFVTLQRVAVHTWCSHQLGGREKGDLACRERTGMHQPWRRFARSGHLLFYNNISSAEQIID